MNTSSLHIRRSRGFTLIEAMVALVVFSMAAMGIYSWINTNLISLNRLADLAASEQVLNSSIERLKLIDLSKETSGAFYVNDYNVQWRADLIEPWRQGKTVAAATGIYDLGLFNMQLTFIKNERQFGHYEYRRTAYKQVRKFSLEGDEPEH